MIVGSEWEAEIFGQDCRINRIGGGVMREWCAWWGWKVVDGERHLLSAVPAEARIRGPALTGLRARVGQNENGGRGFRRG